MDSNDKIEKVISKVEHTFVGPIPNEDHTAWKITGHNGFKDTSFSDFGDAYFSMQYAMVIEACAELGCNTHDTFWVELHATEEAAKDPTNDTPAHWWEAFVREQWSRVCRRMAI